MLELCEDRCVAEDEQPIPSPQLEGGRRVGSAHTAPVHGEDARTGRRADIELGEARAWEAPRHFDPLGVHLLQDLDQPRVDPGPEVAADRAVASFTQGLGELQDAGVRDPEELQGTGDGAGMSFVRPG